MFSFINSKYFRENNDCYLEKKKIFISEESNVFLVGYFISEKRDEND